MALGQKETLTRVLVVKQTGEGGETSMFYLAYLYFYTISLQFLLDTVMIHMGKHGGPQNKE